MSKKSKPFKYFNELTKKQQESLSDVIPVKDRPYVSIMTQVDEWLEIMNTWCDKVIELNQGFVLTTSLSTQKHDLKILGKNLPLCNSSDFSSGSGFSIHYNVTNIQWFASAEMAHLFAELNNIVNWTQREYEVISGSNFAKLEKQKVLKRHELLLQKEAENKL